MRSLMSLLWLCLSLSLSSHLSAGYTQTSSEHLQEIRRTMIEMLDQNSHEFRDYIKEQQKYQTKERRARDDSDTYFFVSCLVIPAAITLIPAIHKAREAKKYAKKFDKKFMCQYDKALLTEKKVEDALGAVSFQGAFDRTTPISEPELENINTHFGRLLCKEDLLTLNKSIMEKKFEIYEWSIQEKTKNIESKKDREKEFKHYSDLKSLRRYFIEKLANEYNDMY